jgi:hypothetical protein
MGAGFLHRMLRPVYYRHEFARRNPDVLVDAKGVFDRFPLVGSMLAGGWGFLDVRDGVPVTIADCLVTEFRQEAAETKQQYMRKALAGFVRKWRVLPLPPPPSLFFPREMGCGASEVDVSNASVTGQEQTFDTADRLFVAWRSLLGFERFLIAEGMTDAPCFMPVVPLNQFHGAEGIHDVGPMQVAGVSKNRLLVAVDNDHPLEDLSAHLEVLLGHLDVLDRGRRNDPVTKVSSERMPWTSFDLYLEVKDFLLAADQNKGIKELAIDFQQRRGHLVSPEKLGPLVADFKRWGDEADRWVREYRDIR